jgi:hypothetical protein
VIHPTSEPGKKIRKRKIENSRKKLNFAAFTFVPSHLSRISNSSLQASSCTRPMLTFEVTKCEKSVISNFKWKLKLLEKTKTKRTGSATVNGQNSNYFNGFFNFKSYSFSSASALFTIFSNLVISNFITYQQLGILTLHKR